MPNVEDLELRLHPISGVMLSAKGESAEGEIIGTVVFTQYDSIGEFRVGTEYNQKIEDYLCRYTFLATYNDFCEIQFTNKLSKLAKAEWNLSERKHYKTVALMQPAILPWMGYLELVLNSDIFVFLDDFQFSRQNTEHRNRLFLSQDKCDFYTWPINHPGELGATFLDVSEHSPEFHRKKFLKSIHYGYAKSPNYKNVYSALEELLSRKHENLAELQYDHLTMILNLLGVTKKIIKSSEFSSSHLKRSERVIKLIEDTHSNYYYSARGSFGYMEEDKIFPSPKIDVVFQDFEFRSYNQGNRKGLEFIPGLPVLDALFNLPTNEVVDHIKSTRRWKTWNDLKNRM